MGTRQESRKRTSSKVSSPASDIIARDNITSSSTNFKNSFACLPTASFLRSSCISCAVATTASNVRHILENGFVQLSKRCFAALSVDIFDNHTGLSWRSRTCFEQRARRTSECCSSCAMEYRDMTTFSAILCRYGPHFHVRLVIRRAPWGLSLPTTFRLGKSQPKWLGLRRQRPHRHRRRGQGRRLQQCPAACAPPAARPLPRLC